MSQGKPVSTFRIMLRCHALYGWWTPCRANCFLLCLFLIVPVMRVTLGGGGKCGSIWDDWMHGPKSCRSDRP
jgi:hypothetical protein